MTNLERLIKAHTEATTITTLSSATEKVAEEMAREFAKTPEFKAEVQKLVRLFFGGTMQALAKSNGRNARRKTARKKR